MDAPEHDTRCHPLRKNNGPDATERPARHVSSRYGAIAGHVWEMHETALAGPAHTAHEAEKGVRVPCTPQILMAVGPAHEHTGYATKAAKAGSWTNGPAFFSFPAREDGPHIEDCPSL